MSEHLSIRRTFWFLRVGLFSSTLMENVLFGKAYDHQLFSRVTRVAALDHVNQYDTPFSNLYSALTLGYSTTKAWLEYLRWWSRRHVSGGKRNQSNLPEPFFVLRVKRRASIWLEHSTVMQVFTSSTTHCPLSMSKFPITYSISKFQPES